MFKFLKNLFFKKEKEYLEIEVDKEKGVMMVKTNKKLSPEELIDILIENLGDE